MLLGVDIGGTKISVSLGDPEGRIVERVRFASRYEDVPRSPEQVIQEIIARAKSLGVAGVSQIGISCAGPLDTRRGLILSPPNMPGWDEVPICEILAQRLGKPARLENDANAGALAEWQFGAGRGTTDMIFLTCSTGMGGGIISGGRLLRGADGWAGEVGHMRLTETGPQGHGRVGSFEGWSSGSGIALQARRPSGEVGRAALDGDLQAITLITRAGEMLGRGIAILCDVLNPELVVCGTIAMRLGDLYLGPARRVLAQEALKPCLVVPAFLGDDLPDKASLAVAALTD